MEIPEKWRELLASVRSVFPTAIIAGGAMRDLENGKPVKDIDINVEANGQTFTSIKASVHRLFPGLILVSNNGSYRSEEHTSELQSLMRISYACLCLKKKKKTTK